MVKYTVNFLVAIDQLCNAAIGGFADETLSSRAYRLSKKGTWYHKGPALAINCLFCWDYENVYYEFPKDRFTLLARRYHCELSYLSEKKRLQMPPELRNKTN